MRVWKCFGIALILGLSLEAKADPYSVGKYTSGEPGPVNTWWIETPNKKLVVVDAQRDFESARAAVDAIKLTGKAVKAILLTHPHPDHVSGLKVFAQAFPGVPIYAQPATAKEMREDSQTFLAMSAKANKVMSLDLPTPKMLGDQDTFSVDGMRIDVKEFGPSESVAASVYFIPDAKLLISGDIVTTGLVPFLAEGRVAKWLDQIRRLAANYPVNVRVLPGHGEDDILNNIAPKQIAYLTAYKEKLAAAIAKSKSESEDKEKQGVVDAAMRNDFGFKAGVAGMPLDEMNELNFKAVARELRSGESGFIKAGK